MKTSDEKKSKIKQTLMATRLRRQGQVCKVFELKIDSSSLNLAQKKFLGKVFIEAKWFYNHSLSQQDIFNRSVVKVKEVLVKKDDKFESRKLECLSSQMKQALHERIIEAIKVLSKLKKKNLKVGRLKFKPEINSIELTQYKMTWDFKGKRIRIQGCKFPLKVSGIDQIPEGSEFANAFLVRKPSGYYIHVTTFQPKKERKKTGKEVGIDMGIKDTITTSDGEKFNCIIVESPRLKSLQRAFAKTKKGSRNRYDLLKKIKLEYERLGNKKKDFANKIVSHLNESYDKIYIQDESIDGWKRWFGKTVQHSALGAIKTRLKNLESIQVISRWEPTTKLCYKCGKINRVSLDERTYRCTCGLEEDRDIKAAKTILLMGQGKLPTKKKIKTNTSAERSCTSVEEVASAVVLSFQNHRKLSPLKREAHDFSRG